MKKFYKLFALMITISLILAFAGCSIKPAKKEFKVEEMSITLTDKFFEKEIMSQTGYFEAPTEIVCVTKESFSLLESVFGSSDMSIEEYANIILTGNKIDDELKEEDGLYSFTYERTVENKDFYYQSYVFKSDNAFWLVQFSCFAKDMKNHTDNFVEYAKSIKFE